MNDVLNDTLNLNKPAKAKLFHLLTKVYGLKNKEEIEYFYNKKAELLFRGLNNKERLLDVLYARFELIINQKNLVDNNNAKYYLDEYYDLVKNTNNHNQLVKAYKGFARLNFNPNKYDEALFYYDKAIEQVKKTNDTLTYANIINNKGLIISAFLKKQDSARVFFEKAIQLYKSINNKEEEFGTLLNIGLSYIREEKVQESLKWFKSADSITLVKYKNNNKKELYGYMANAYENIKDYKKALDYVWLYNDYKDSIDLKSQNIAITDQQIKYKSLEKEKENSDLKRKQLILFGVVAASIAMLIFGYLSYRNIKKKKEIAEKNTAIEQQKFVALVKDQELISMDSMIEGQEKERKRIAEDLHDNLGSTLATLKLHFDNYRVHLSTDNVKQIKMLDSTENILDEAYNKVRTMAHANQASILAEHSLVEAVKSLAFKISSANKTEIEVIDFGFDKSLNHALEITVFRIIQELITNIVKHANAKKATIDLTLFDDSLGLIVEDDGNGFDINKLETEIDGMGLSSIKNRIEDIDGSFSVDTSIGKGTSILIDIPVNKNEI